MDKPLVAKMKENYKYFGGMSLIYGVIFAFCLYKNVYGITFPVYVAVTIVFALLFMKKINFTVQKGTMPYFAGMLLLGISSCMTTSFFFIFFNWIGIMLLFAVAMIHQFYNDRAWNLPAYLGRICILFGTTIAHFFWPFSHAAEANKGKEKQKNGTTIAIIIGLFVALGLLAIILPLLLNSDMIFAKVFGDILKYINIGTIFGIGFTIIFGFICCYAFFSALCTYNFPMEKEGKSNQFNPVIGITFSSVLAVIYVIYSLIQIVFLFIGLDKGLPSGVTYAEYARSGYWELLFVSIINFLMILISMYLFKENMILNIVLTIISGCTFIMIGSAGYRMMLYISQYHLTFLRVLVMWSLVLIGLVMIGTVISIYKKKFPLFRYSVLILSCCYIVLSLSRPDYWIAKYNVAKMEEVSVEDLHYLIYNLSYDAAPIVATIDPEEVNGEYYDTEYIKGDMYDYFRELSNMNQGIYFRKANYSRIRAKHAAEIYLKEHEEDKQYTGYYYE